MWRCGCNSEWRCITGGMLLLSKLLMPMREKDGGSGEKINDSVLVSRYEV
jgi:hypothetical protein